MNEARFELNSLASDRERVFRFNFNFLAFSTNNRGTLSPNRESVNTFINFEIFFETRVFETLASTKARLLVVAFARRV